MHIQYKLQVEAVAIFILKSFLFVRHIDCKVIEPNTSLNFNYIRFLI